MSSQNLTQDLNTSRAATGLYQIQGELLIYFSYSVSENRYCDETNYPRRLAGIVFWPFITISDPVMTGLNEFVNLYLLSVEQREP